MNRSGPKKKSFSTASEVLGRAGCGKRIAELIRLNRLWGLWCEIAGESLASHARPLRWQGRDLVVRVEHPAWVQELSFLKQKLRERIDEVFPEARLRNIKFDVGPLPVPPGGTEKAMPIKRRELSEEEMEFIDQAAREIRDEETREAARSAMIRDFQSR